MRKLFSLFLCVLMICLMLTGCSESFIDKFREDIPMYYNVAMDANDNTPVLLDDIIERMKEKAKECLSYL